MSTRESILAILKDVPAPRIRQIGEGWQIGFAWVGGARKDGDSLARDLRAKWYTEAPPKGYEGPRPAPEPVIDYHADRDGSPAPMMTATDAEIERLRKLVDELQAKAAQPERVEIPAFLKEPEPVPSDLAEFVRVGETYEQTNERLLPPYREAQHMKERAIEDGDKSARVYWETKIRKIDLSVHWMHGRLIETV